MFLCIALNTAARRVRRKSEQFRKKSLGYRHFGNPETQGTAVLITREEVCVKTMGFPVSLLLLVLGSVGWILYQLQTAEPSLKEEKLLQYNNLR